MLKEISGQCSQGDAKVLAELGNRYPVIVGVDPGKSLTGTVITFTETIEGSIGPRFFGDMQRFLAYAALFDELALKQITDVPVINPQPAKVIQPIKERPLMPSVSASVITALWGRVVSFATGVIYSPTGS